MPSLNLSRLRVLVIVTSASSLLPYVLPSLWYSLDSTKGYDLSAIPFAFIGSLLWLLLIVITLQINRWERRFFWLLALFPVGFGPWLVILYIYIHAWLFGFAP
jgi:hypothetical protein